MSPRYAWPQFRRPWTAEVDDVVIDQAPSPDAIDRAHRRVRLDTVPWDTFACSLRVTTAEPAPPSVSSFEGFAVVSCPRTQTRIPFALVPDGVNVLTGRIQASSDELVGKAKLTVAIVSEIAGRRRTVGTADEWVFVADESAAPISTGTPPFPSVWIDFTSADAPEVARRAPTAYAVMDLAGEPRLLLNDAIAGFARLLDASRAQGERRRLRDLLGATIARDALSSLFRAAVTEVGANGEPVTPPVERIFRQSCEAVAAVMPTVASVDDLYERVIAAAHGSSRDWTLFWMEVDAAMGLMTGLHDAVKRATDEVRHG